MMEIGSIARIRAIIHKKIGRSPLYVCTLKPILHYANVPRCKEKCNQRVFLPSAKCNIENKDFNFVTIVCKTYNNVVVSIKNLIP